MKKLLILSILLIMLTSGCWISPPTDYGLFDLNGWAIPNNPEFLALVEELNTPQEIGNYMLEYFEYERHTFPLSPYELYITKKGDCDDFATFARFIADWHNYPTHLIGIFYENTTDKHILAVYDEGQYSFSSNRWYFRAKHNNFLEVVEYYSLFGSNVWSEYIVYNYNLNVIEQGTN